MNPSSQGHPGDPDGVRRETWSRHQPLRTWFESGSPQDQDDDASEWEQEVNDNGQLFYILQKLPQNEPKVFGTTQVNQESKEGSGSKGRSPGGKLSRLVRRRESKRERSQGQPRVPTSKKSQPPIHNYESSDNDSSSTYGQIKTFETLFEGSPVAKPLLAAKNDSVKGATDSEDNASSSSGEMTEIHEVFVKFNAKQFKSQLQHFQMVIDNPRNNGLLLEVLLGIVPERKLSLSEDASVVLDTSIVVSRLIPDSPSAKGSTELKPGDILRSMDGFHVTQDNINSFLLQKLATNSHSTSCKAKLIIQRAKHRKKMSATETVEAMPSYLTDSSKVEFLKIVDGQPLDWNEQLSRLPHFALYATKRHISDSSPESADILFIYPDDTRSDPRQEILVRIRGIFITLNQLLSEMTIGSQEQLSVSSLVIGSGRGPTDLIHVAYLGEGEDVFLIGVPGCKVSAKSLACAGQDVVRFLRLKHGSLARAFAKRESAPSFELQKLFKSIFQELLLDLDSTDQSTNPFFEMKTLFAQSAVGFERESGLIQWLHLPDEIKFQVEDALNQLECADFQDQSDDFYELPREFHILGSCLFHKGFLVASHLHRDQLLDTVLWCRMNQLLKLTRQESVNRLVAWQEIFPIWSNDPAYFEQDHRHFLLIVGRDNQLLGVVLQTGGCTAQPSGVVRPDPFYVDQALNTLDHLHEMGISIVCNKWITLAPNPDILNIDKLYQQTDKKREKQNEQILQSAGVVLCRTKSVHHESVTGSISEDTDPNNSSSTSSNMSEELQTVFREDFQETESSREKITKDNFSRKKSSSFGSGRASEDDDTSSWKLPRSGQRNHLNFADAKSKGSNSGTVSMDGNDTEQLVAYKVSQLSLSHENTIFHYMHLDFGEGVFISPLATPDTPFQSEVMNQFRVACHIIHSYFQSTLNSRESIRSGCHSKSWINRNFMAIKEQAMLFHWKPQPILGTKAGPPPVLSYWVCGRLFGPPGSVRECFVAYHESATQLMIELAFRLVYGVQL